MQMMKHDCQIQIAVVAIFFVVVGARMDTLLEFIVKVKIVMFSK